MLFKCKNLMFYRFTRKKTLLHEMVVVVGGGGGGGGGGGDWCPLAPSFSKALHDGDTEGALAFHKSWIGESLFSFLSVLLYSREL